MLTMTKPQASGQTFAEFHSRAEPKLRRALVARYGGEEFAVILRETDHEGALVIADRLRERIAILRLKHDGQSVCLTASFGVASSSCCPNPARLTREWFVASADSALYQAKQSGRNRVCLASDDEAD